MIRSAGQYNNHPLRHVIQTEFVKPDLAEGGRTYPAFFTEECSAGRFRKFRRGKTISFLTATFDSDSFQVLHSEEATDEPLHFNDILLRASCYAQSGTEAQVSVVWKDLHVRATRIINQKSIPPTKKKTQ